MGCTRFTMNHQKNHQGTTNLRGVRRELRCMPNF
jgi:hypothetical protein